ncbi:MAG: HD family phosphohydrolase [Vagococcus sp.]
MTFDIKSLPQKLGKKFLPILVLTMSLILFAFMFGSVRQKQVDFKIGKLAEETIRANKTIENKRETEEKQRLATESVSPEYTYDGNQAKVQENLMTKLFSMVTEVNDEAQKKYNQNLEKAKDKKSVSELTVEEKLPMLKSKFEKLNADDLTYYQSFPDSFYEQLFDLSPNELTATKEASLKLVDEVMTKKIRNSNLQIEKQDALERVNFLNISTTSQSIVGKIIEKSIVVNEVANEKATDKMKEIALNTVQPAMIYQGEIIVREGEQIDSKAMEKISLLGLDNQSTSIFPIIAVLCVLLLQIILVSYLYFKEPNENLRNTNLMFYFVAILVSIFLMKVIFLFQKDTTNAVGLIFPAAFGPLMLHLFLGKRWGILLSLFQSIFSMFIFYNLAGTTSLLVISMLYVFAGSISTFLDRKRISEQLTQASFLLIVMPILFTAVLLAYQGMGITDSKTLTNIFFAFVSGIFSFILSIGLYPYIELLFTDDSVIVLNELSNPTHPLLKKLLEEAPGTYHHSMMVASLSANAVAEIGGRSLLTRVACYYHDIGKLKHANFFVENLPAGAENPHNFLLPSDSKEIIFGHVSDGVKVLKEAKMPQFIVDVCQQHHGKTLVKYFYIKEQERNSETNEASFRYPGPIPQCREIGVINIADSAEAAVRAMDNPTNEKIRKFVHDLIQGRIEDGQLLDSGLTLKELKIVEDSIVNGLCSTFHSRIKYPKMKSEAEKMKQEQEERRI